MLAQLLGTGLCHGPPNAFGQLETDYSPRGFFVQLDDLEVYVAQPGVAGSGQKAVVWAHDIFGPNSGRTYELVDQLAADTEYTVLLPDFYRGQVNPPLEDFLWDNQLRVNYKAKLAKWAKDTSYNKS